VNLGPLGFLDLDDAKFGKVIAIDLEGTFHGMQAVLPHMLEKGSGSIINISSTAGLRHDMSSSAAYVAAKFAVRGLTKSAAFEFAGRNVRVNAILPGATLTPMAQEILRDEGIRAMAEASLPIKRFAQPQEVSQAVLLLASDVSSYINGVDLPVDGAWTARNS
jgi:3alpha(or 20beta)-hydroxysteroid dehydrogenase